MTVSVSRSTMRGTDALHREVLRLLVDGGILVPAPGVDADRATRTLHGSCGGTGTIRSSGSLPPLAARPTIPHRATSSPTADTSRERG